MKLAKPLLIVAFVFSGFATLTYEMSWMRRLVSLFGVTYPAITTILTVFMGGIAAGSLVAGRLIDRVRLSPLVAFIGLELFLGLYGQVFPYALSGVEGIYLWSAEWGPDSLAFQTALHFVFGSVILLPPTLASGATLPVVCKAFVQSDEDIGRGVSWMYGGNLLGATLGCYVTTFFTIGLFGFPATAWTGTGANLCAALLGGLALWRFGTPTTTAEVVVSSDEAGAWTPRATVVAVAYLTVGFAALAIEILWTRCFSQFGFNPSTFVFGLILTTFLLGHGAGSWVVYPVLQRRVSPERLFTGLIGLMGLCSGLAILAMLPRVGTMDAVVTLRRLSLVLPLERALLLFPAVFMPAVCTGALFPLASQLAIRGVGGLGQGVGSLAALSTVGGIAGSFLTGFLFMPWLGAVACLVLVTGMLLVVAVWCRYTLEGEPDPARKSPVRPMVVLAAVFAGLALLAPPHAHMILFDGEEVLKFTEGRNSSTVVLRHPTHGKTMLIHGERVAGGGSDPGLLVALHPEARMAVVMGVGSGLVTLDALRQESLDEVWGVDIDGELLDMVQFMRGQEAAVMSTEKFRFFENDGRHFLLTSTNQYDILINDAALYAWYLELSTLEFNKLARSRLKPGGLYAGRLHMWRISNDAFKREVATFLAVFPNATMWKLSDDIGMLVGRAGDEPIRVQRHSRVQVRRDLPELWYSTEQLHAVAEGAKLITDDHPLHLPHTFLQEDRYPLIEYTEPVEINEFHPAPFERESAREQGGGPVPRAEQIPPEAAPGDR